MSRAPVQVRELVHAYDRDPVLAVDELDLSPGRWHLAGPNGAGKTTLLRILATLVRPSAGRVRVAGHALPGEAERVRAAIGFAGHEPSLHEALRAEDALGLHARLHEVPVSEAGAALEAWDLAGAGDRRVGELSFGQRRRLDLARSLLHDPDVVLWDEPSRGLDEPSRATMEQRLTDAEPELVLVAAPGDTPLDVDERLRLVDGRLQEAPP